MSKHSRVDVIIPSYNGKYLLEKNLPYVLKNTPNLGKLIIIDNGSDDDTASWLQEKYPEVVVIRNNSNLGYTKPVNQGVARSDSELFILMNNDVRPGKDYLNNSLSYFSDSELFAVSFNEEGASWPDMSWDGKIQYSNGKDRSRVILSPWASGGSAIFSRSIWDKLGGFDEIYSPFYWEDIDIGYRAWKTGYKIIWVPNSTVIHEHESTAKKLKPSYVSLIRQRNELLFNWLNITDKKFVLDHIGYLLKYTMGNPGYLKIVIYALWRYITHPHLKRSFVKTDIDVLNRISKPA